MATVESAPQGAFSFELTRRNALLEQRGMKAPGFTKTGTTIAGIIFKVRGARARLWERREGGGGARIDRRSAPAPRRARRGAASLARIWPHKAFHVASLVPAVG